MASKTSGKTKLFISYSRKDRGRIERLYDALASEEDVRIFRDTDDILPTEEWKPRLEKLIRESDTIVFALSPASAASEVCAWELELAASLNKRIIPIVVENVDGAVPEAVSKLNYIFLTEADDFGRGLTKIQDAISLDIDWVREHTRLGELADRWEKAVRLGAQPLRGKELEAAERWLVKQPKNAPQPTELQRRYILESRKAATRRARITVMGSIAAMLIVGVLGVFAWVQRGEAVAQKLVAEAETQRAELAQVEAETQRGEAVAQKEGAQISESLFFEGEAGRLLSLGRADSALELAKHAIPGPDETTARPLVESSHWLFSTATLQSRVQHVFMLNPNPQETVDEYIRSPCVSISPDGAMVGYCHGLDSIFLYRLESDRMIKSAEIPFKNAGLVAFSSDSAKFVAISMDGLLAEFDTDGNALTDPVQVAGGRTPVPHSVHYLDSDYVLVAVGNTYLVNLKTKEISNLGFWPMPEFQDHLVRAMKFALDPTGQEPTWLLDRGNSNLGDERILFPDSSSQAAGENLSQAPISAVSISDSGRVGLISQRTGTNTVHLWDVSAKVKIAEFQQVKTSCFIVGLDFPIFSDATGVHLISPQSGQAVWTAGSESERQDGRYDGADILCDLGGDGLGIKVGATLEIWELLDKNPRSENFGFTKAAVIEVLPHGINEARLLTGGRALVAANYKGYSGIWDISARYTVDERVQSPASFDGLNLLGAFDDGIESQVIHRHKSITVSIRDDLDKIEVVNHETSPARSIAFGAASPVVKVSDFGSGRYLALLRENGRVYLFDVERGVLLAEYSANTFSLGGSRLIDFATDEALGLMYLLTNKDKVVSFPLQPRPVAEIFARSAATFSDGSMLSEVERCEMNIAEANVCW